MLVANLFFFTVWAVIGVLLFGWWRPWLGRRRAERAEALALEMQRNWRVRVIVSAYSAAEAVIWFGSVLVGSCMLTALFLLQLGMAWENALPWRF